MSRFASHVARLLAGFALAAAATVPDAAAQIRRDRTWIAVNAGIQAASGGIDDRFQFERHVETATVSVDYGNEPAVAFEGGGGYRFWRNVGAGVVLSRSTRNGEAEIDAGIPHPFFDNRHRAVTGTDGASRTETGVHVQLTYTIASRTRALLVTLSGGPSHLRVEQELVTDVLYAESFPFDEAAFTGAVTARSSASATGFHAGVDIAWMTGRRRQVGVGGMVRFSRASMDLETPASAADRRTIAATAGGLHAGAGLRLQF